jgi:outer membrane immunogenic protein
MMTRTILCSVLTLLTTATTASAQSEWYGAYAGFNVRGGLGNSQATTSTIYTTDGYFATTSVPAINEAGVQAVKPKGLLAGGQAGYNYQTGALVVGFEADFGIAPITSSSSASVTEDYPCCAGTDFTIEQTVEPSWLMTARPRFGYATESLLLYGTAGLAIAKVDYQAVFTDTYADATESGGVQKNVTGWAAGAGMEGPLSEGWSFKVEYLFTDLGEVSTTSDNFEAFGFPWSNTFTHQTTIRMHLLRFGVNVRF